MAMKAIKFTNGLNLPVYNTETIAITSGVAQQYAQSDAALAIGKDGSILNSALIGQNLTDEDGNIWAFSGSTAAMTLTIVRQGGGIKTFNLNPRDGNGRDCIYVLWLNSTDSSGYHIKVRQIAPTLSSATATTQVYRTYVNGVNGSYVYADDLTAHASKANLRLANRIVSSQPFPSVEGVFKRNTTYDIGDLDYYLGTYAASTLFNDDIAVFSDNAFGPYTPPSESTDPYLPEGVDASGTGGGTGTFSETGDTIGIPGLPTLSAVDTGFITLFNPSAAQVKSLANYMWSAGFDLTTFKNIVANPIDCILGLTIVPVSPSSAGSKTVTVGNIPTNISLPYLSSQYVEVDCGTLNVQEFWGSYLDYSPYTKMSLYLPYIGIIPLDIDDVMNASIEIKYHVDVLSGACVAYVLCNGTQLYTYVGQCSSNVPITSNDFTNTVNGILGIAGSIGKLAADGGASAPTEAAGIAANAINALKPNIQKSGAMSGTGGLMGVQTPYLICQRPRQSVPAFQNSFTGYPANITARLSTLSGYTEVESIHLDGLAATQEEQQEIMDLLTTGVII